MTVGRTGTENHFNESVFERSNHRRRKRTAVIKEANVWLQRNSDPKVGTDEVGNGNSKKCGEGTLKPSGDNDVGITKTSSAGKSDKKQQRASKKRKDDIHSNDSAQ